LKEKIPHKALLLSPRKYNEVVGDGKSHNAVSVKVALHNQAIFLLLQSGAKPDKIVIDPSGAGAKSDQVAAKLLQAYGDQALQATAKYHFANTKKAYQRLK